MLCLVLCHVDVRITPPPFSSGLGTGNGGDIPFRFNYNLKNYWHSIVKDELLKTYWQLCETELLQRFQPAYKCLDCIEKYLDHIGGINLGYEVKVKNHCLNQIHEEYLNNI